MSRYCQAETPNGVITVSTTFVIITSFYSFTTKACIPGHYSFVLPVSWTWYNWNYTILFCAFFCSTLHLQDSSILLHVAIVKLIFITVFCLPMYIYLPLGDIWNLPYTSEFIIVVSKLVFWSSRPASLLVHNPPCIHRTLCKSSHIANLIKSSGLKTL